jgi:hypothetical protein
MLAVSPLVSRMSPLVRTLVLISAAAFVVRLAYALAAAPGVTGFGDDAFLHFAASELAHGGGYVGTFDVSSAGTKLPTALY